MAGRLAGKVAVITGAASGIGAATARRFVAEGARVVIADVQDNAGGALAAELGDGATFVHTDVSVEEEVAGAIATAVDRWGSLDVIYNNAGFTGAIGQVEQLTSFDWDRSMDVLLKGVFFGMKHAAPIMKAQRSGSIISTASVCGLRAGIGPHPYTTAKAAVIALTESVALELAEFGVRVNAICPGYIATPLTAGMRLDRVDAETASKRMAAISDAFTEDQPIARNGEADDIASMALFLASDDATWVTGTAQVVDGGLLLGTPWRDQPPLLTKYRGMQR